MDATISFVAPAPGLPVEVVQVLEVDARPEALLDHPDTALDFAFGLRRVGFADARRDTNGGHEVGELRMPFGGGAIHLKQHGFHAVGQHGARQSTKILTGFHEAAEHGGGITAFDEDDKAHARVAQDRRKAVELARSAVVLVVKLAPVELELIPRLGLVAQHREVTDLGRPERMDKILEDTDMTGVAQGLEASEHGVAVIQMVLRDPAPDLVLVGVEFGRPSGASLRRGCPA